MSQPTQPTGVTPADQFCRVLALFSGPLKQAEIVEAWSAAQNPAARHSQLEFLYNDPEGQSVFLLPPGHARDTSVPHKLSYAAEPSHSGCPVWEHWRNPAFPKRTVHWKSVHGWFSKRYLPECAAHCCFRKIWAGTHTQVRRLLGLYRTVWVTLGSRQPTTDARQGSSQTCTSSSSTYTWAGRGCCRFSRISSMTARSPKFLSLHHTSWCVGGPRS